MVFESKSPMHPEHLPVQVKNYSFMLPAVAVWEDFNDLRLNNNRSLRNEKQPNKLVKDSLTSEKQQLIYFGKQEPKINDCDNEERRAGNFVQCSEFTLNHSVLNPSSRASVRLKPLKNAPVPKIDNKQEGRQFRSVKETSRRFIPAQSKVNEKKIFIDEPMSFKKYSENKRDKEMLPKISYLLEAEYKSDLDNIEPSKTETMFKPDKTMEESESNTAAIESSQQNDSMDEDIANKDTVKNITSTDSDGKDTESIVTMNISLPHIKDSSPSDTTDTFNETTSSKEAVQADSSSLPHFNLPKNRTKRTSQYSIKDRFTILKNASNVREKKHNINQNRKISLKDRSTFKSLKSKEDNEFVVDGGKSQAKYKRKLSTEPKNKSQTKQKKMPFQGRVNQPAQNDSEIVLPSINEKTAGVNLVNTSDCEDDIMDIEDELAEERGIDDKDTCSQNLLSLLDVTAPSCPDSNKNLSIENLPRIKSGKILEYPMKVASEYERELIAQKKNQIRKLDIDGDGHLSFFELAKCFPNELSKPQTDYLKLIYHKACDSTFFGLEEFLCVDQMCCMMVQLGDDLRRAYSDINLRTVEENFEIYLVNFSERYQSSSSLAFFETLLERAESDRDKSTLKKLLESFSSLKKDLNVGLTKADLLVLIPVLVAGVLEPDKFLV